MSCEDLTNVSTSDFTILIVISAHYSRNSNLFKTFVVQNLEIYIPFQILMFYTVLHLHENVWEHLFQRV